MEKVLVGELRDSIKLDVIINDIKEIKYKELKIKVLQYLPITKKIQLITSIYESAVNRENGLLTLDKNLLDLALKQLVVEYYTNLTLPKDVFESYDLLMGTGLYYKVIEAIPERELETVVQLLDNHIEVGKEEYEQKGKLDYIVKNTLKELVKYIDGTMKTIEDFDPSKMEYLNKFMELNKGEQDDKSNKLVATC